MRKENISAEITERAFDFFYWFSRFEFSLKENGYLKYNNPGDRAEPGWDNFVQNHSDKYSLSRKRSINPTWRTGLFSGSRGRSW